MMAIALATLPLSNAHAQHLLRVIDDGWAVLIDDDEGDVLRCRSYTGELVYWIEDPYLDNVGRASMSGGRPIITLNLDEIDDEGINWVSRVFWLFHECAHHALHPAENSEVAADCWAAREMARVGYFRYDDYDGDIESTFDNDFHDMQASPAGHLHGSDRAALIEECAREIMPSLGPRPPGY
jgi:hypothetical protein